MSYINWNPDLEIFSILGYPIRWYGLLWGIGLIAAYYIVARIYRSNDTEGLKEVGSILRKYSFQFVFILMADLHILDMRG